MGLSSQSMIKNDSCTTCHVGCPRKKFVFKKFLYKVLFKSLPLHVEDKSKDF